MYCKIPNFAAHCYCLWLVPIRNYLYKNRPNTTSFPDKVRNNSDFLLFAFCNIENSHWFVIEKQIFLNSVAFSLAMKPGDNSTSSWQRKDQIYASLWSEKCRNCQLLKLHHKLPFLISVISTKQITFYRLYCKAVRSLLHCQPVSVTSYLPQTGCESPYVGGPKKNEIF